MKSYVDGFFNPTGVPVRLMVNKPRTQNSAVSEHANETGHVPQNQVKFIERVSLEIALGGLLKLINIRVSFPLTSWVRLRYSVRYE